VILEGRELGTAGLYEPDGSLRENLVEAILGRISADRLIFEAPRTAQQAWLINRLGPEVNLGNIMPDDALGVETLRLGLRADTASLALPANAGLRRSASTGGTSW
jgi:phosphosulfolactate synthase